jgi:NAD(P)-dependent dehydrogenase (short-subunit alcohol dehydrogenase family)
VPSEKAVSPAPLAFVTGASSGIGQALARRFAVAGWRLALLSRRADEIAAWARAEGLQDAQFGVYAADVRDVAAMAAAARGCIDRFGLPDVVIANAGISIGVDNADPEDLPVVRAIVDTNLVGLATTFQPFVGPMCARGSGRLVGVASVAGIRGLPGHAAYCASKAGAIAYCESLRGECRPHGVRVVTLVPGYVDTPLTRGNRYAMPFLMSADAFAERAFRTIEAGVSYRVIPWPMAVVARLLRLLPDPLFDRLVAGRPRKQRRHDGGAPQPPHGAGERR